MSIKKIFNNENKEKLITDDGKRNLYFDKARKNFIKFSLDVKTTCEYIFQTYKEDINKKLIEIYGNDVNIEEFSFLIVELIGNKLQKKPTYIELKIGMNDTMLFNVLQNNQLMLCFLPKNVYNYGIKKNSKNIIEYSPMKKDFYKSVKHSKFNWKNKNNITVYLAKTIIHYYNNDKKSFSKEKIKITENEISILYGKQTQSINQLLTKFFNYEKDLFTHCDDCLRLWQCVCPDELQF